MPKSPLAVFTADSAVGLFLAAAAVAAGAGIRPSIWHLCASVHAYTSCGVAPGLQQSLVAITLFLSHGLYSLLGMRFKALIVDVGLM
jgi:hypothetical protein